MTIFFHFASGYTLNHLAGIPGEVNMFLALTGTYPDAAALPETIRKNYSGMYGHLHHREPLLWFWPWTALHLGIDRLTHKKTGGYYWWVKYAEGVLWLGLIAYWASVKGWL